MKKRLDEILARCEAATPKCEPCIECQKCECNYLPHARTDLPLVTQALKKAVEALVNIGHTSHLTVMELLRFQDSKSAIDALTLRGQTARVALAEIEKMLGAENKKPPKDESSSGQGSLASRTTELVPIKYHKCRYCGLEIGEAAQLPGCLGGGE